MAFPTLFPHGKEDPTKKTRLREVSLTEGFKHLIKYADLSPLQTFTWRFASHPRFPYWALNMKQRHQLLSQARIYLTQNPQDANLTTEELREMVQQMSAQQLMNRLQRYVAKIQGTRQYWHQRYQELKALITQKGAPTFFFTFSAADNYWPDLHRLLQEPEDPTPSIRIKAVIDHPHLTDSYFVTRLEEFCNHWLDNVLGTEWKWLRYEWQARGSIHAHGCAKLNNDPGLCNLVKVAAFGWKLQQILRLHEEQPSHQELADDYRIHIDEGNQAQAKVIEYVDWLVTTINESLPQENWTLPSPHPSALPFQRIENEDTDYHALVNSVERHTKCSTAYCIKVKPGQPPACRFNYPKECQENTSIDFQLIVKGCDDEREMTADEIANARVKATITTKRNDDRINSHNHVMLQHWRANVDLQAIVDTDQCIRYMAKYATKGEPRSQSASDILKVCVNRLRDNDMASSALRRAMIQVVGDRDIGSQETAHLLLGKPLYSSTFAFLCVSLDGSRRVRIGQDENDNQGDEALDPSIIDNYASRAQWQGNHPEVQNLNIVQFASTYQVTKGELRRRKQEIVIRTFPNFSSNPSGKNYGKYCKYQLIKYKPWSGQVTSVWNELEDNDDNHIQCYHDFLSSATASNYVPMLAQELEQAESYNGQGNEEEDDDEDNELPIRQEEPEEWMLLCRLNQHYENDIAQTDPSQNQSQFDWTETARMMPHHLVRESANGISKKRNEAREDPAEIINQHQQETVDVDTLNTNQRLAYNIVANHQQSLTTENPLDPLYMIVLGTAGTGKSYLINTFSNLLGNNCILTGTTGMAGYNIQGCTAHSAVQLPVRNYNNNELQGAALQRLQLRLSGKHYLILDEMSMLGQRTLAWLDKRLRQATGKLHVPLGGISVLLLGDFGQLPPVGDRAIYSPPSGSLLGDHGHSIYTLFATVVILMENVRQAGNNPEAESFRELLLNIRDGNITQDDWKKLQERTPQNVSMEYFKDAVRLFFDKQSVAKYNFEKLQSLGTPIVRISAIHSGRNARAAKSDDAGGLDSEIFLARGAAVMLTSNLWQEVGLCNGASGVVKDFIFHTDRPPPCLPIAALVKFPKYKGPAFLEDNPQTVPIPPHLFEWESEGQRLSRQQLPLRLRYAMTIHKSQGQTLYQAVIDLGKTERAAGCTFVAASRVRSLQNVVFQPMSFQRLQSIGKSKQLQQRLQEEERLRYLAQITAEQYQHLNV